MDIRWIVKPPLAQVSKPGFGFVWGPRFFPRFFPGFPRVFPGFSQVFPRFESTRALSLGLLLVASCTLLHILHT